MRSQTRKHGQVGGGRRASGEIVAGYLASAVLMGLILVGCGGGGSSNSNDAGAGTGGTTGSGGSTGNDSGTPGTGGKTGDAGTPITGANLGKACTSAVTCGAGLTCLLPTDSAIFGTGGPANGYCTLACTPDTAAACNAGGGTCVNMGPDTNTPQIFCLQNCTRGMAGAAGKCQNRPDVACTALRAPADGGVASTVCIPTCSQDIDCPNGRVCDEATGVCVNMQSPGSPTGTHCAFDPNATTDSCAGGCLPLSTGGVVKASFCSRRCPFLQLNACNYVGMAMSLATGGPHSVCGLASTGSALGDQGYCVQLCDNASDCTNQADPGLSCDLSVQTQIGHGICSWGAPASDGGTDTAPGDAAPADGGAG